MHDNQENITELTLPKPIVKIRKLTAEVKQIAIKQGLDPLLAQIIAARPLPEGLSPNELINLSLSSLDHPHKLKDMEKAALRIAKAVIAGEIIALETDHDCDGQTSHAVLYTNLTQHFKHPLSKLQSYIGHRLTEGYGLSAAVAARILANNPRPNLLITADNGSSDEARIKELAAAGIEVIVTDHHMIPVTELPVSAYAFINPTQNDCAYTDKYIAGCMVAWLLMVATRQSLIDLKYLPNNTAKLMDTLDYVAVGTVADCVSLAKSKNNRPIINYGLKLIAQGRRPCWRVLKTLFNTDLELTAEDLAFKIAPLLNSDGRLSSAFGSVNFLLATTDIIAKEQLIELQQQNQQRKLIQQEITQQSLKQAAKQLVERKFSICLYLTDGHVGVHGISASRIKDYFGRPTAIFSPKNSELISGSIRTIDGFHVRNGLQFIADLEPKLLLAFGGHQGAGGVTIKEQDFAKFSALFEQAAAQQLNINDLGPVLWTDGEIAGEKINLTTLELFKCLEPFGREFEQPIFQAKAKLLAMNIIGDGTHARVCLEIDGSRCHGVWFNLRQAKHLPLPVVVGSQVLAVFSLRANNYAGQQNCELQVYLLR